MFLLKAHCSLVKAIKISRELSTFNSFYYFSYMETFSEILSLSRYSVSHFHRHPVNSESIIKDMEQIAINSTNKSTNESMLNDHALE